MSEELVTVDFGTPVQMTKAELRDMIARIEEACKVGGEAIDIPIHHHFSKDVYAREMRMPKGALVVGKIHKHQNLNILSGGEASILSVDGVKRVKAPYTFVASPGAKRVIFAHEELTWTVIHGTNETDLDKIESEFIAKSYDEVVQIEGEQLCLGLP